MRKFSRVVITMIAATVLSVTGFGQGNDALANTKFSDIKGHWAEGAVYKATQDGIIKGFPDGSFRPNESVSTVDFATMLIRAYGEGDQITPYPVGTESFMKKMNYPYSSNRKTKIIRSQVAELVSSTKGYNLKGDTAIKYLLGYDLANGKVPGEKSVDSFKGKDLLTRAEAVVFIDNVRNQGLGDIQARPDQPEGSDFLDEIERKYKQEKLEQGVNLQTDPRVIYQNTHEKLKTLGFTDDSMVNEKYDSYTLKNSDGTDKVRILNQQGYLTVIVTSRTDTAYKAVETVVSKGWGLTVDDEFRLYLENAQQGFFEDKYKINGYDVYFASGLYGDAIRVDIPMN